MRRRSRRGRGTSTSPRVLRRLDDIGYDGRALVEYFDLPEHGWATPIPAPTRSRCATSSAPSDADLRSDPSVCCRSGHYDRKRNRRDEWFRLAEVGEAGLAVGALEVEQRALAVEPAAVAGERSVDADDPVARDDDPDRVATVREPDRA